MKSFLQKRGKDVVIYDINALINSVSSGFRNAEYLKKKIKKKESYFQNSSSLKAADKIFNRLGDELIKHIPIKAPEIVGISINTKKQLFTSLAIIKRLKDESGVYTIIGGPYVTLFVEKIFYDFDFIDYAVVGPGEIAMLKVADAFSGKISLRDVPGLWFRDNGKIQNNERFDWDIEDQEVSDYTDLDLRLYDSHDHMPIFPYATSKGCLNSCKFCTYNKIDGKWKKKSIKKIIGDLTDLEMKYSAGKFLFIDSAIDLSFAHIDSLCDKLIELKKMYKWVAFVCGSNLNKKILTKMKQAGCSSLLWGIESASEILLKKMGKNINLKHNFNMLEYSNSIGIKNKIFLMINYPYETIDDLNQTIGFIKRFSAAGNFFLIKTLEIQWDSYIYNNAGQLGINLKNSSTPNIYEYEEAVVRNSEKDIKTLKKYRREILSYDNRSALIKQRK
ncbi:MAG: radical SAM protein [Candidatus Omnitrophica bacterium]|nr:radical SAM protein [Candidatus Omnitrophota bacterium]